MQLQRPGLLLADGVVCIAFGSRGDWDLKQLDLLCTTPNNAQGGIWQAGQCVLADAQGNVYAGTGNGDSQQEPGVAGTPNMGESFLKLRLQNDHLVVVGRSMIWTISRTTKTKR